MVSGGQNYTTKSQRKTPGRLKFLATTRNGTDWDTTTWSYQPLTGRLANKRYPDQNGVDYTYTSAGRLHTRTWARGVVTTYGYSVGRLETIDYSDATPDVTNTYNRLGQLLTVSQSGAATSPDADHVFTYHPGHLGLATETIAIDPDGSGPLPSLTRTLTRSRDNLRRPTGFVLGNDHAVGYGYDVSGRLATFSAQGLPNLPGKTHAFEYTYEVVSNLIDKVTGPVHEVDNDYEPHRDVLLQKTNTRTVGIPGELSVIGYTVNAIGQRDQRNLSGELMEFYLGQSTDLYTTDWGYDALGQVTSEDKPSTAADRGFSYDKIGNRLTSSADGVTTTYTPNQLNQYTAITGSPTLSPQYDLDGNMTSGLLNGSGNGQFEYDGANQIIRTQTTATSDPTRYAYDAFGRRIAKVTYPNAGGAATAATVFLYDGWNLVAEYKLSSGAWTLDRTYTWGIDLSGSTQAAGGVGGLLAVTWHEAPPTGSGQASTLHFYPIYDGKGNIEAYLDSNGQATAIYQYDAFGNILSGGGKGAAIEQAEFSHRFSTKYQDAETGLLYYGFRYYAPDTGRWPSRDPIGESGGLNLYGFVGNDGVNRWDYLGREISSITANTTFRGAASDLTDATPRSITVNVRMKLHWECAPEGAPSLEKQRSITKAIERFWDGTYRKRPRRLLPGTIFSAREVTHRFDLTIDATYHDVGDSKPSGSDANVIKFLADSTSASHVERVGGTIVSMAKRSWTRQATYNHEIGHVMGLVDRYYDFVGGGESRQSEPVEGWRGNVMAQSSGSVDYRNIEELIVGHYDSVNPNLPGMATENQAEDYFEQLKRESYERYGYRRNLTRDEVVNNDQ